MTLLQGLEASIQKQNRNRRIFVGDVHGHYDALMRMMEAIAPGTDDQVYFLGDLIDRGPQSAQVLDFVRQYGYTSLMGNHEQMLLEAFPNGRASAAALQAWLFSGGQTTVASYDRPGYLLDQLDWIRTFPLYLDLGDIWLVHAGMHPNLSIADHTTQELCWIREVFHSNPKPYFPDKLIITGHTITFTLPGVAPGMIARGAGWLDIDTGAYHPKSGWLTALDFSQQRVYQVQVADNNVRSLPLDEVAVTIDPTKVKNRRQQLMQL
ncbi:MAG: metallophosphoesterase family protein [Synechococcales bacterium]|nr:metallophosphoesterase family protein [Synechococcales bacterium]